MLFLKPSALRDTSLTIKYLDVKSFIDYFIVNEVSRNVDGYRLSSYFYKDRKLCSYDTKAFEEKCMSYNDTLLKTVRIEKDRLFLQYSDSVKAVENSIK